MYTIGAAALRPSIMNMKPLTGLHCLVAKIGHIQKTNADMLVVVMRAKKKFLAP
jgi:hypothetical protein